MNRKASTPAIPYDSSPTCSLGQVYIKHLTDISRKKKDGTKQF